MAYAGDLLFNTKIDKSGFESGTKDIEGTSGRFLKRLKTGLVAGIAVVGSAIAAAGVIGIKYNAQMEQYMASFETMLGSASKARAHMEDLKKMAAATPFEMSDLAEASKTLLAFGVDVSEIQGSLKMLGDISQGNKERFNGLALVFGQVKSQGKLMGQDLLQMINAGFNPLQIISEKTGESMSSLKDKMAKGQITFEMVAQAMQWATSEGGKFHGAMEKQSKTAIGLFSTLKDNVNEKLGEAFEKVSAIITTKVLPSAIKFVEKIDVGKVINGFATLLKIALTLAPVIAAIVISAKLHKGIMAVQMAWKAATAALLAHEAASRITMVTQLGGLTKTQTAVGLLTGKLKIAAVAQGVFNRVLAANPYVLIASAIGLAVAGFVAYNFAMRNSETAKEAQRLKELDAAAREASEGIREAQTAGKKKAEEDTSEVTYLQGLKRELDGLVDANGRVKDGYQARADFIVGQLAKATGIEISLVDGVVNGYDTLSAKIDDYLLKKKAQIWMEANEEAYKKAVKTRIKLQDDYIAKLDKVRDAEKRVAEANKSGATGQQTSAMLGLAKAQDDLTTSSKNYKNALEVTDKYERDAMLFKRGQYQEIIDLNNGRSNSEKDVSKKTREELVKREDVLKQSLAANKELLSQHYSEALAQQIESDEAELAQVQYKLDGMTGQITANGPATAEAMKMNMLAARLAAGEVDFAALGIKIPQEIQQKIKDGVPLTAAEMRALLAKIEEAGKGHSFLGLGYGIVEGIASGINAKRNMLGGVMMSLVQSALKAGIDKAQINSPSRLFRDKLGVSIPEGVAVAIDAGRKTVRKAMSGLVEAALPTRDIDVGTRLHFTAPVTPPPIVKGTEVPARISAAYVQKGAEADILTKLLAKLDELEYRDIQQNINFNRPVETPVDAKNQLARMARIGLAVDR